MNRLAFGGSEEADIIEALRAAHAVTLSLVAADPEVVGHVLFSPVRIGDIAAVGLAPMAVHPARQRSGIGSALIRAGLSRLRDAGQRIVVVLGHASYYPRFGFERASLHGIRWEHPCPDEAFMALALHPGALDGVSGVARYRPELGGR